jgi:polyisoprenoid-binding protein YceI
MHARERWLIDATRSKLQFVLRHMILSEIRGEFGHWGGELSVDPGDRARSSVDVWIGLASIQTGQPERDQHLRSPELLDVGRFPRAEFRSTVVALSGDSEALLTGRLDLHGVTGTVELRVMAQRTWVDEGGRTRAEYVVRGRMNRQAFGLHWNQDLDFGGVVVGDHVDIEARVQVVRLVEAVRRLGGSSSHESAVSP